MWKQGRVTFFFLWLGLSFLSSGRYGLAAEQRMPPVGLGLEMSAIQDKNAYSFLIEGHNHFRQKETEFEIRQYGVGESRLLLGSKGVGLRLNAISGITVIGLADDEKGFSPHVGVEPFSGKVAWLSSDRFESFYQWLPMVSLGLQLDKAGCRILPLVRGGAGIGNLQRSFFWTHGAPAYGLGSHLNCKRWNFAAEATRIPYFEQNLSFYLADFSYRLKRDLEFGVRAEAQSGLPWIESQIFISVRSSAFGQP